MQIEIGMVVATTMVDLTVAKCVLGENALAPDFRHMALVGKIGDSEPFYIGSNCRFKVSQPGILYLGCNDALNGKDPNGYRDNSGSVTVGIIIK